MVKFFKKLINSFILQVPGNFHFSTHAYSEIINKLQKEGIYKNDLTHTVNHLIFGYDFDVDVVQRLFTDKNHKNTLSPLDGKRQVTGEGFNKNYEYYLKVI